MFYYQIRTKYVIGPTIYLYCGVKLYASENDVVMT